MISKDDSDPDADPDDSSGALSENILAGQVEARAHLFIKSRGAENYGVVSQTSGSGFSHDGSALSFHASSGALRRIRRCLQVASDPFAIGFVACELLRQEPFLREHDPVMEHRPDNYRNQVHPGKGVYQ